MALDWQETHLVLMLDTRAASKQRPKAHSALRLLGTFSRGLDFSCLVSS